MDRLKCAEVFVFTELAVSVGEYALLQPHYCRL
jgi:hypothetical protein